MHIIGSKTSSAEEFLKEVNPKIAIIGVGENNGTKQVSETGKKYLVNHFRTSELGCAGEIGKNTVVKYLEQTCVVKL